MGVDVESLTVDLEPIAPSLTWASEAPSPAVLEAGTGVEPLLSAHPGLRYGLIARELSLSSVPDGKPARLAGIQQGDSLVGLDGKVIEAWAEVVAGVSGAFEGTVEFLVLRGDGLLAISVAPEVETFVGPDGNTVRTARVGIGLAAELGTERLAKAFVLCIEANIHRFH